LGQEGARIGFSLENNKSSRVLSLGLHLWNLNFE
jgi:hypothetical protein